MAISKGNTSEHYQNSSTSPSFSHNHDEGTNGLVAVAFHINGSTGAIASPTYGGSAMTFVASSLGGSSESRVYLYYIKTNTTGSQTIAYTHGGASNLRTGAGVRSYGGVLASPIGDTDNTLGTSNNSPELSFTGLTPGSVLFDGMTNFANALSVGAGQNEISNQHPVGSIRWGTSDKNAEGTSDSMAWSTVSASRWGYAGMEIKSATGPPGVTTGAAENVFASSVKIGSSEVTSTGNLTITERGVVLDTSSGPTTSDTKEVVAGSLGSYDTDFTGLTAETIYYVRAFATNSEGTSYGAEVSFTTDINAAMPIMMADNPVNFNTPIIL